MVIALRRAAALAGRQLAVAEPFFPGEALANRAVGVDFINHLPPVALAQILKHDLDELLGDKVRAGITHRWPPGVAGRWRAVAQRYREPCAPSVPAPRAFRPDSDGRRRLYARPFAHDR